MINLTPLQEAERLVKTKEQQAALVKLEKDFLSQIHLYTWFLEPEKMI